MIKINCPEKGSITHISLLLTAGIVSLLLATNVVRSQTAQSQNVLSESSTASEVSSDNEASTDSEEESVDDTSIASTDEASTESVDAEEEVSTLSMPNETSTLSEPSTLNEENETSEASQLSIGNFETVEEFSNGFAIVSNKERLFFLIPVDIEKTLELDENGNITGVKQTLLSRILELLSF